MNRTAPSYETECLRKVAKVAARHLDNLPTNDRIMVCEGIASLFPTNSNEAIQASEHADQLRRVERQQLLLTELLES